MKNSIIILFVITVAALTSCNKEDAPEAAFEASTTAAVVDEEIDFTITGIGEFWSFWPGDGSPAMNIEEDKFQYSYTVPGTYKAIVIASNFLDDFSVQRDSAMIQITITDNEEHAHTRFSTYKLDFRYNFAGFEDKKIKYKLDGLINGTEISFEVPNSAILDDMKSVFAIPGTSKAYIGNVLQESTRTRNDFNNPVEYRIVASDGTEEINTVTVTRLPKSSNSQLLSFDLTGMPGGITSSSTQDGNSVDVLLTDSTGLTALKAAFSIHDFARAYIDGVEQVSEKTTSDYSAGVVLNVIAEDGTESNYEINVLFTPVLVRFFFGEGNPFVAEGLFNETMDTVFVDAPADSDLTALKPSFITRPFDCVVRLGGVVQEPGVTETDFSSPLICTISGDTDTEVVISVQ
ncbi:MAG: hypothetical protein ABFS10_03065 [Bacteroidota bacterium]